MVLTSAVWRVKEGREAEFEAAWHWHVDILRSLPSPLRSSALWRSAEDQRTFLSFGEWDDLAAVEAMNASPRAPEVVARMSGLCDDIEAHAWIAPPGDPRGGPG